MASLEADVQKSCLDAFGSSKALKALKPLATPHETLHARMAQFRIASDSGMSVGDSTDTASIRQHREQTRIRAILQLNMGSAMGMATPGELLFKEALPPCPRWGDRIMQTFAARGFDHVSMDELGGMGVASRPGVPGPLQLTKASQRVGPHGSPEALEQQEIPICSYGQMVEEARAQAASAKPATVGAGAAFGMELISEEEDEVEEKDLADGEIGTSTGKRKPDWTAEAQHGRRRWPPAILESSAASKEALELTKQIGVVIDGLGVKDHVLSCVPGAYTATVEFVLSAQTLAPIHRDAYAALGLGAPSGKRNDIMGAGKRAQLLAAVAFATGNSDLGSAFRDLAQGPLEVCARKPWLV